MLLISNDSKYLFSVDESRLNVFSIQSGELVFKLSHLNLPIISICINPLNKFQLLSFHSDGKLCIWDYEDGLLLKAVETNLNVKKVICKKANLYVIVSSDESSQPQKNNADETTLDRRYALYKLILDNSIISSTQATVGKQLILKNIALNGDKFQIDISNEENYVACLEGRKHLSIYEIGREQQNKKFNAKMDLTCLVMHPNEDCIATGASNGKIILWYNFLACMREKNRLGEEDIEERNVDEEMNVDVDEQEEESDSSDDDDDDKEKRIRIKKKREIEKSKSIKQQPSKVVIVKPTKSILHWHSLPVVAIKFTPEGSFLLSGGHECVLVKWLYKTGQKDFRPRLGSPITDIVSSLDNTLYTTRHLDNTVHLMSANLNIIQTIAPFLCPNSSSNCAAIKSAEPAVGLYPTGLNYFPAMNCIVTNGKPGHLQFYAHVSEKLLFNLDVVEENYISPENLNKPLIHTQIECLTVNQNCEWLATVERRNDAITTPDVKLKFWSFDKANKKFTLNTIVKCPHSFDRVTRIKFKPNETVLFSSGEDTCLKSWVTQKSLLKDDQASVTWSYNSSNGYRDLTPFDFEFLRLNSEIEASKGRSICCASFDHILTLWLVEIDGSMTFANDLVHCDASDRVREVKALRVAGSNFVLAAHGKCMNVWRLDEKEDLRTGRLELDAACIWSKRSSILDVYPTLENELILFDSSHESVIQMLKLTLNASGKAKDDDRQNVEVKLIELRKHRLTAPANGPINLLLLPNSDANATEVYYCDNKGIFYQMFENESSESDLSEQMWTSREKVIRNLPDSSLAKLIGETAKSAAASLNNSLNMVDITIDEAKNPEFEANFRKIETTPAYLLPKVSSYCYTTLKSLLLKN